MVVVVAAELRMHRANNGFLGSVHETAHTAWCCFLQMLQMVGRAGRPQFDTEGVAVIMTSKDNTTRYQRLLAGQVCSCTCQHWPTRSVYLCIVRNAHHPEHGTGVNQRACSCCSAGTFPPALCAAGYCRPFAMCRQNEGVTHASPEYTQHACFCAVFMTHHYRAFGHSAANPPFAALCRCLRCCLCLCSLLRAA